MTVVDHRRATADRNRVAILDATERILGRRESLSMVSVAAEAGVSRPTLYAHFKTLADILEAAVARSVDQSMSAFEGARPDDGLADEAVCRMIEASWEALGGLDALARGGAEHLSAEQVHRAHAPLMHRTAGVIERGRRDGIFRLDMPTDWLVSSYYALIHGADGYARMPKVKRSQVLDLLKATILDMLAAS